MEVNSNMQEMNNNLNVQEMIKDKILNGGRFGGNAARRMVYQLNKDEFNKYDKEQIRRDTKVYKNEFVVTSDNNFNTITGVKNCDCVDLALEMKNTGLNPAILNLASNKMPCGGYDKGLGAQEESLCYQSTLPISLYQFGNPKYKCVREMGGNIKTGVYPMDINFGGIYSKSVTFFRYNINRFYTLRETKFDCPIITVASLANTDYHEYASEEESNYFLPSGYMTEEGRRIEANKIRTIFRIALDNQHDSLVLGAFGCGAYHLMCDEVSGLFKEVLNEPEFKNKFKVVYFAIIEGKGSRKLVGPLGKFRAFYQDFGAL